MDILKNLKERYAVKLFNKEKIVSEADKEKLIEIGLLSPSSFGLQPWRFVIVESLEYKKKLRKAAFGQPQTQNSTFAIILCRIDDYSEKNFINPYIDDLVKKRGKTHEELADYKQVMLDYLFKMTKQELDAWAKAQVYIALGNMITSATTMGLDTCPMEGFNPELLEKHFSLKEKGLVPCVLLTVGYRDEKDFYAKEEKVRYDKDDMILRL
ncbi:MAG: NAD(P)H-dependent oxidoreductase [Candidatus Gracilibacteria bacterium]|nr:NAD(P)H-dependent oxidoreductase [Candidatus Gracilibacteria bacterium]